MNITNITNDTLLDPLTADPIGPAPWMPEIVFYIIRAGLTGATGYYAYKDVFPDGKANADGVHAFSGWNYQATAWSFLFTWVHFLLRELRGSLNMPAW